MKHTCHSKGAQSHINTQCTPSGSNAGMYSCMQMVIKVPNVILRLIVPRVLHPFRNLAMVVADSGKRVRFCFIMSHTCSIGERSRILLARAVVVHHEEHVALQQPYVGMRCPAEKAHRLPVKEMAEARV